LEEIHASKKWGLQEFLKGIDQCGVLIANIISKFAKENLFKK